MSESKFNVLILLTDVFEMIASLIYFCPSGGSTVLFAISVP